MNLEIKPATFEEVKTALKDFQDFVYCRIDALILSLQLLQIDINKQSQELRDEADELRAEIENPTPRGH